MRPARWDETERTYEVGGATVLPDLVGVHAVARVGPPVEVSLEAVYFDTAGLDLARHDVTLRRRTGGEDAGWHLKLPQEGDTRTEVRHPLGRATRTVPEALLPPVRAWVRDRELVPIARISTRRLEYALLGGGGGTSSWPTSATTTCTPSDFTAACRSASGASGRWSCDDDAGEALLDAVEEALSGAGAARASSRSKLVRTLGDAAPVAPAHPSRKALARGSATQAAIAHLSSQVEALHVQDARLRAVAPGSVHKLRIAARRLRSALKTYGPVLDRELADRLTDELRWLGGSLGDARDAQVLRERLHQLVATQPVELVLGPVATRIDDELREAERMGMHQATGVLDGERYFRLLDALDAAVARPRPSPTQGMRRHVKSCRACCNGTPSGSAVRSRRSTGPRPPDRDLALHEARKKAKRLRYGAESTVPVLGKRAKRLAASVKKVQQALGTHQDTVMSRRVLREYGVRAHLSGENGFTFGRLHALEEARAGAARRDFEARGTRCPGRTCVAGDPRSRSSSPTFSASPSEVAARRVWLPRQDYRTGSCAAREERRWTPAQRARCVPSAAGRAPRTRSSSAGSAP